MDRAFSWLDDLVGSTGADFLKRDFNRSFTETGTGASGRRAHLDHARALLDRLRAARPALRIESCAGGGRIDPGVLARADQVWPSDNTDPVDRLTVQHVSPGPTPRR
ncbi:alpha-galactosidase [Kitasatospora cineracea]|uniref:alpha-galactosidase n=1 Tax=Kitasatospora cineracea TaxID=88074 RepID=UPI0024469BB4|nr:alpha-galactosidase [Kitasatospora cineracea]